MPRKVAPGRLEDIGKAALTVFSRVGFKRAQVADVAKAAGVAQGTIYLHAPGKEALFWMALQFALGEKIEPEEPGIIERIPEKLKVLSSIPSLTQPDASLKDLVTQTYEAIEKLAPAIRLIEACTGDWPELAAVFYGDLRPVLVKRIANFLQAGVQGKTLREIPDIPMAARLILETIAWFAIHRHGDADGRFFDNEAAKQATIDALTHAFTICDTK